MFYTKDKHEAVLNEIRPIRKYVDEEFTRHIAKLSESLDAQRDDIRTMARGMSVNEFVDSVSLMLDTKLEHSIGGLWNKIDDLVKNLLLTIEILKDNTLKESDVEKAIERKIKVNNEYLLKEIKTLIKNAHKKKEY